jgi:nitrite reductase/ring-hydroxylating ferredoxin subunit/multimeric flavodoxin WrbA
MIEKQSWTFIGKTTELVQELESNGGLKEIFFEGKKIVLTYFQGKFGALNNKCNHMGGPLAKGKLKNGCVECPWHYWQFDRVTGESLSVEASRHYTSSGGAVPHFPIKEEGDSLYVDLAHESKRTPASYNMKGNLARDPKREPGKTRVLGISTTAMDKDHPRFSTSEELLKSALDQAAQQFDVETKIIALSDLKIRNCEGFYSKSERACTWPCSITKMDPTDEMSVIYENLVHWADVVIVATPIRWGGASSLYYKIVERLNSVQNQMTVKNKILIQNKVVGLILTGGQDNIQAVAGQMLAFFGELGFMAPAFPYVAHSLGWSSEDMERNMDYVKNSELLHNEARNLVGRSVELARRLIPDAEKHP